MTLQARQVADASQSTRREPIHALTGLRFAAAMWVVLHHYGSVINYPPVIKEYLANGQPGVSLFFVLSGFVLVYNYHSWFQQDTRRSLEFLQARFARIFPVYLLSLLLMTPVTIAFLTSNYGPGALALSWVANLLAIHAWIPNDIITVWDLPSWSISDEFFFYLLFPFFVRYVLSYFDRVNSLLFLSVGLYGFEVLFFLLAAFVVSMTHLPFWHTLGYFTYTFPLARMWEFFLGGTAGLILMRARQQSGGSEVASLGSTQLRNRALILVLLTLFGVQLVTKVVGSLTHTTTLLVGLRWYVLYTPVFLGLIMIIAYGPTFLSRILEHRLMRILGEASYSLYMVHWIPLAILQNQQHRPGLLLALSAMLGTVLASVALYKVVEIPARRALRRRPTLQPT